MKNILLLISLFITLKAFGQAIPPPVNPQPVPQMSWSREPSTNKMFANRGPVLGYWQPVDSLQAIRMIGDISPTLTFNNGTSKSGNIVGLGGNPLIRNTIIPTATFTLAIGNYSTGANGDVLLQVGGGVFALIGSTNDRIAQIANNFGLQFVSTNTVGGEQAIRMLDAGFKIKNTITNDGVQYDSDPSTLGHLNPLWIPNYGAVTTLDAANVKLTGAQTIGNGDNTAIKHFTDNIEGGTPGTQWSITKDGNAVFRNISFSSDGIGSANFSSKVLFNNAVPVSILYNPTVFSDNRIHISVNDNISTSNEKIAYLSDFYSKAHIDSLISSITPAYIIYTSGTGTANTFTNSSLQNVFIDGVWRDGIEYFVTSGTPVGNQVTVNTTTGVVLFQDNINTGEYIKIRYRGVSGTSSGGGNPQLITVSSYSEMASQLSGSAYKVFYVKADEVNGGGNPTEYLFYNGILIRNVPQQAN